jgi:hypothetical protein
MSAGFSPHEDVVVEALFECRACLGEEAFAVVAETLMDGHCGPILEWLVDHAEAHRSTGGCPAPLQDGVRA